MKNFKAAFSFLLSFCSLQSFSQSSEKVEMADVLRQDGKIYTVVIGLVIILTAMIIVLIRVDRKISKLENKPGK